MKAIPNQDALKAKLKQPIFTTFYNKFFLLRLEVVINGQHACVEANRTGWLSLNCRNSKVGMTFDALVTDVNAVLQQHGLHGVSNYWCEEVPLFELKISSYDDLNKLFDLEGEIKEELALRMSAQMSKFQDDESPILKVVVQPKIYLLTSALDQNPIRVERENMLDLFTESEVFNFGSLVHKVRTNPRRACRGPLTIKELESELYMIVDWFNVGIHLGVEEHTLQIIAKDHPRDTQRCRAEMFSAWLKGEGAAGWSDIVMALAKTGRKDVSNMIAHKYGVPLPSPALASPTAKLQANLQLKIGMDQELSEKHYVYKPSESETKMYEQKLYGEKVLQEERQKYELQMVEKSTEVKMLREAKEELKAQLEQERKRNDLLEQSVKKIHLQSVPQPMQGVNPLTPTPLENTAEEKLSSDVDSALHSSRDHLREAAQLHENPKGPPVKEKKKTNHPSQEIHMMCVQSPHTKPRLAERVMKQCSCDTKVKPLTYVLDMTPDKSKKKLSMIEKYTFGPRPRSRITKRVLMIVGATGAGKTTIINGMINYIFGVRWEDAFRFKMVVENPITQAESVTQKITAYTIYHQEGAAINFSLTIVDIPGFGDTKGIERNKRIVSQIKEFFFLSPSEGGVDRLDAIGFVTQASLARLTPTQRYIFDSILSVFGKNVGENIFMMITFADGKKPPVVDAIKAANIPYRKLFKFNNSAIYPHSEQKHQGAFDSSEEEGEGGDFSRMYWDMGMKSFENFFTRFRVVEPQSLQLTNEVLEERQRLETTINSLQPQINERLAKIEELRHEERILKEHESDMLTNKDFKYTVTITKQRKVDLKRGHYVTNCLVCNYTCHRDCKYNNDSDKWKCSAMDDGDIDTASCRVCPGGGCHWTQHVNNPYRFKLYQEDVKRTQKDLKQKYAQAAEGKVHVQGMIKTINDRLSQLDEHVKEMIDQVRESTKRLGEIALKPNPLTEVEYIDLLIESEKQEAKPGYQARIKYFQDVRKRAQLATEVLSRPTPAGRHGSEIALKPNPPTRKRAQLATGGIPTPAGGHGSEIALKPNPPTRKRAQLATGGIRTPAGSHGSEIALKPNPPTRKRAQQATGVISMPNPAGRRGSEARTSLWKSSRNLW